MAAEPGARLVLVKLSQSVAICGLLVDVAIAVVVLHFGVHTVRRKPRVLSQTRDAVQLEEVSPHALVHRVLELIHNVARSGAEGEPVVAVAVLRGQSFQMEDGVAAKALPSAHIVRTGAVYRGGGGCGGGW